MFLSLLGARTCFTCENVLRQQVRFAGHSKWSNIRHIKGANDALRAKLTHQYCFRIQLAIKERNGDNNPDTNVKLKRLITEAYSSGIPKSSLQNTIRNFKDTETIECPMEIKLSGGIALYVENIAKSRQHAELKVLTVLKKRGGSGTLERHPKTKFDRKGIILAEVNKESLGLLEDDAIEAGAEDVELVSEEDLIAEFVTNVNDLASVKEVLEGKGYKCLDSNIKYIPETPCNPSPMESKAALNLKGFLEELDTVVAVHENF